MGFAMRGHPAGKPTEVTEQGTLLATLNREQEGDTTCMPRGGKSSPGRVAVFP